MLMKLTCVSDAESPIGAPALQALGRSNPPSQTYLDNTCPACAKLMPHGAPTCPHCGYAPTPEWILLGEGPQPSRILERSREQPSGSGKSTRRRHGWLALIGALVVVISVVVGGLMFRLPTSGEGFQVDNNQGSQVDDGNVDDAIPQGCMFVESMGSAWPREGIRLGNDQFTSLSGLSAVDPVVCLTTTQTGFQADFKVPADQQESVIGGYAIWLQTNDVFTASQIDRSSGQFWRRSVDSGQWLYLEISSAGDEVTVTVDKGNRDVVPDGLIAATSNLPASVTCIVRIGEHETLTSTPGWEQYPVYLPGFASEYRSQHLRYNKISDQFAEGTLEAYVFDMRYDTDTSSLPDAAAYWMRIFDPNIMESVIAAGEQTTVAGVPAMRYTMYESDSVTTFVYIQGRTAKFVIVAEVDNSSGDLLGEIDSIINSAQLSG